MPTPFRTLLLATLLGAVALAPARAAGGEEKGEPHADRIAEARKAIEAGDAKFAEAVKKGDAAAVAQLYTEDAIVLPDGAEMRKGRAAIEKYWREQIAAGVKDVKLATVDVDRSGRIAAETGTFEMTIQPEGKSATKATGKYVVVWKADKAGTWRLHRDVWNGDAPPAAAKP